VPHYVGKANVSVADRLSAHRLSGRYNPATDNVAQFDLGDICNETTLSTEQAAMSALGTVQKGQSGYNQRNNFQGDALGRAQETGLDVIAEDPEFAWTIKSFQAEILGQDVLPAQYYSVMQFSASGLRLRDAASEEEAILEGADRP
jgi:hypothetical protein